MKRIALCWLLLLLAGCVRPAEPAAPPAAPATSPAPTVPPAAPAEERRELWLVSPADLAAGRMEAGRRHTISVDGSSGLLISPDGARALQFMADTSRIRTVHPSWVEVITLATDERYRINLPAEWWTVGSWLPDGRIIIAGEEIWVTGPDGKGLKSLGRPGRLVGGTVIGNDLLVAVRSGDPQSNEFKVAVIDSQTGSRPNFNGPFYNAVNPKAGAELIPSPSGDAVAFKDWRGGEAKVLLLDLESGTTRTLVEYNARQVLWTPEGLWVWEEQESPSPDLILLNKNGEELRRRALPRGHVSPSPDGRWLALWPSDVGGFSLVDVKTGEFIKPDLPDARFAGWTTAGELALALLPS